MSDRSPLDRLAGEPRHFGFDAAVRLLLHAARTPDPADVVRFRSAPGLAYPPADVLSIAQGDASLPPKLTVTVMGLTGASGVLPRGYTEVLNATLRTRSRALHDFVDVLSHRLVALFARAGSKYRPHRAAEVNQLAGHVRNAVARDPVSDVLLSLTGYATGKMTDRLPAGADALLHYSGFFATRPRSAERLEAMISDWCGRPVQVLQFAGAWLPLPPDQRTRLYQARGTAQFSQLGVDSAAGVRAWDVQARIVLRIGPLDRASFEALLPDRPQLERMVSLVRAFLGFETGFAINPVLAADAVPPLALRADADPPPRLGWNTWATTTAGAKRPKDAADAVFEAEVVEARSLAGAQAAPSLDRSGERRAA
jgi:type VI secretion system protein ImpH